MRESQIQEDLALMEARLGRNQTKALTPPLFRLLRFQKMGFVLALALINAIEVVNRSPLLTAANTTLGYRILDSCSDVSTALRATNELMQQGSCRGSGGASSCGQHIAVVVGAWYSAMSIAIARQLTLRMIPQVRQRLEDTGWFWGLEQDRHRKTKKSFFLLTKQNLESDNTAEERRDEDTRVGLVSPGFVL